MHRDNQEDNKFKDLREKAEASLPRPSWIEDVTKVSIDDIQHLVHELRVHQAELESQNEELRRAQLELQESKDRYVDLYDFAPVGYFTLDKEGKILEVNLSGTLLVNRKKRSLIRLPFLTLVLRDDYAVFFNFLRRVFQQPVKQNCELRLQKHGSGPVDVRIEGISLEAEGEICRIAVSDITELKQAEEEMLSTQTRVLSSMAEGVCVCDDKGGILFTNAAFDAMFGYARNELLGKSALELEECLGEEIATTLPKGLAESTANGHWSGDLIGCRKDGATFDAHVRMNVLESFGKWRLIAVWEDITALRQTERALRTSEHRFRTIFESANDLIFIKDRSSAYTHVSPSFAKLFDRNPADIVGMNYKDLFGREGAAYEKDVDTRVFDGQTIEEESTKTINGVTRRFQEVRVPLRDDSGNVIGLCGIARDITERRARQLWPRHEAEAPLSSVMRKTLKLALHAAKRESVVLLQGESGSGKDHLARYIHDHSERSGGPYFSINCAALPTALAESELFGHERGSFTGAHARKRGLLELAEGGTLLLNEIGDLPPALQAKLLTFLDTRKFTRVGGEKEISVNARLIFATNKDLQKEVETGRFRQDLFYRINVVSITVPPLRDRIEDIPVLAHELLAELASELQITYAPSMGPEFETALVKYDWPGNIRELRNDLERSLMLSEGRSLHLILPSIKQDQQKWFHEPVFPSDGKTLHDVADELIESLCLEALRRCNDNRRRAARMLGISRDSFYRYMKRFGLLSARESDQREFE